MRELIWISGSETESKCTYFSAAEQGRAGFSNPAERTVRIGAYAGAYRKNQQGSSDASQNATFTVTYTRFFSISAVM